MKRRTPIIEKLIPEHKKIRLWSREKGWYTKCVKTCPACAVEKALRGVVEWLKGFKSHLTPEEWTQQIVIILQLESVLEAAGIEKEE